MENEEKLLLGIIVGTAGAMLVQSGQYAPEARIFPQAAAVITLVFAAVIIVQKRISIDTSGGSDLISQVQDEAVPTEQGGDGSSVTDLGKSEPGEFRITQPTSPYRIPVLDRDISKRTALAVLLSLYLGLLWLSGIFISSVVFMVLYTSVLKIRRNVAAMLVAFTIVTLVLFGMWLGTPLFRPAHELFTLPEVAL